MKRRDPWYIWGQSGQALVMLKQTSVREGRALRHAKVIKQYTNGQVFISKAATHQKLLTAAGQVRVYA